MEIALTTRIGIGLSVVWMLGATIGLTVADVRVARFLRYSAFEMCDYVNYHLCHCNNCWRDVMAVARFVDQPVINFALIALVPIVLAWLAACGAVIAHHAMTCSSR
jgi:hypothetical protein